MRVLLVDEIRGMASEAVLDGGCAMTPTQMAIRELFVEFGLKLMRRMEQNERRGEAKGGV